MPTLNLWVNSLGTERTGWLRVGSSPYLNTQDQPANYVYSVTRKDEIGDFNFGDTSQSGTINSVTLYVYGQRGGTIVGFVVGIWDGSSWTEYALILPTSWGWVSEVISVLDTWAKINGAKMYIKRPNSTVRTDVDAAYLLVNYTELPLTGFRKLQYFTEPPTTGAFNKLKFASEPPVPGAWNKLLYEGE